MAARIVLAAALVLVPTLSAQVAAPVTTGEIHVSYIEASDAGQATRLQEVAARVKATADRLDPLDRIEIVIVHSRREFDLRVAGKDAGEVAAASYLHGILFLSPVAWAGAASEETLEHEMRRAMIRYAALRLAGGNRLPAWLDQGLWSVLAERPFAPASAEPIVSRAPLLLTQWESDDPAVGYWAVRYLVEARGGLAPLRQLLRLVAHRPDTFVENLEGAYGVPVGELERDWRAWLARLVEEDKRKREDRRDGPLVRDR